MLTDKEFNQWMSYCHLSDQAKSVIEHIRASPPARRVGSRMGNVRGHFNRSRKMNHKVLPPPSISTVTDRLNYKDPSSMYQRHSALCKQISARHRSFKIKQNQSLKVIFLKDSIDAQHICELALNETPPPSVRQVAKRLMDNNGYFRGLKTLYPDLYKLLNTRRKEYCKSIAGLPLEKFEDALHEPPPHQ